MKKTLLMSSLCASILITNASADVNNYVATAQKILSPIDRSIDTGGNLQTIVAFSDGVGALVIDTNAPLDTVSVSNVVFKFGDTAASNNIPVSDQVLASNASTSEIAIANQLNQAKEGQYCDDNNAQTINDVYHNGICAGTLKDCNDNNSLTNDILNADGSCSYVSLESCTNGFFGAKTTNLSCNSKSLSNVNGWTALASTSASVYLDHNALINVDGLSGLTNVGSWVYLNNNSLTNVNGLSHLISIGSGLNLSYNALTNVDGLSGLTTVDGNLYLYNNSLRNVNGLSHLTRVGGTIDLYNNPNLQNLSGLNNVVMNSGSIIRFDSRAYTVKMSATSPICVALKNGTLSRSGATVVQVCN